MIYLIDGQPAPGGGWRHRAAPAPQRRQEETFPGIAERFVVQGPYQGDDLEVRGHLVGQGDTVAEARAALIAGVRAAARLRNDGQVHVVSIDDVQFEAMELVTFHVTGDVEPVAVPAGGYKLRQQVVYRWRELRPQAAGNGGGL